MNPTIEKKLLAIAEERQVKDDPSHDFEHVRRVYNMAKKIAAKVGADPEVVIPAALFHDTIVYKKNSPQSRTETDESAELVEQILSNIPEYPREKIANVKICIAECSFSKEIIPKLLESKVLQDADFLEATGAISIMRTFSSCGHMNRPLYAKDDPLCINGCKNLRSGIDLFFERLLIVRDRVHTEYAKSIAERRINILEDFLKELKIELQEADIISNKDEPIN